MGDVETEAEKNARLGLPGNEGTSTADDETPITRRESRANMDALAASLTASFEGMLLKFLSPKDPEGLIDPNAATNVASPFPVVDGGAKASTPSTEDSDATSKSQKAKNGTGTYAS